MKYCRSITTILILIFLVSSCDTEPKRPEPRERKLNGSSILYIGRESKSNYCDKTAISVFAVNGETDNAWEKYKLGSSLELPAGEIEIWYVCNSLISNKDGNCLYPAPLKHSTIKYDLDVNKSYRVLCSVDGEVELNEEGGLPQNKRDIYGRPVVVKQ